MFFSQKGHKFTALFCSETARRRSIFRIPVQISNQEPHPVRLIVIWREISLDLLVFLCFLLIFSIFPAEKCAVPFLLNIRDTLNSAEARGGCMHWLGETICLYTSLSSSRILCLARTPVQSLAGAKFGFANGLRFSNVVTVFIL